MMPVSEQISAGIVVSMRPEHADEVAVIHQTVLPESIYSDLGRRFLEYYYSRLMKNGAFFGYVHLFDGRVTGFVAATSQSRSIFWRQILLDGWRIAEVLARSIFEHPRTLGTIARACVFLLTERRAMLPQVQGEILSFAVLPAYRARTLGSDGKVRPTAFYAAHRFLVAAELFSAAVRELDRRNVRELKIMTAASNTASNRFYVKMGCRLVPDPFTAFGAPTHLYRGRIEVLAQKSNNVAELADKVAA